MDLHAPDTTRIQGGIFSRSTSGAISAHSVSSSLSSSYSQDRHSTRSKQIDYPINQTAERPSGPRNQWSVVICMNMWYHYNPTEYIQRLFVRVRGRGLAILARFLLSKRYSVGCSDRGNGMWELRPENEQTEGMHRKKCRSPVVGYKNLGLC